MTSATQSQDEDKRRYQQGIAHGIEDARCRRNTHANPELVPAGWSDPFRGWSIKNPPVRPWSEIYSPAEIAAIEESQIKMMNNDPLFNDVRQGL